MEKSHKVLMHMKKTYKNQSGIALMMVLAAIALLTAIGVQFAYDSNVNYHLALNDKEKLQAYFLAESSINLMKLELKLEKQLRSKISSSPVASAIAGNLSGPLCQQMPISTGLIRSMFLGQATGEGEEGNDDGAAAFISAVQVESAEDFLAFEGDFEGMCQDESAKFNLNMFSSKNPEEESLSGVNSYDKAKQMLVSILSLPEYKKLFNEDDSLKQVNEIVRNIADWVDTNTRINEFGGTSTGNESSEYKTGITEYTIKNNKFLTLDELFLVAGVNDEWFNPIKEKFTIYGDEKLNVCIAPDEMVAALIIQYANTTARLPDVNPQDADRVKSLVAVVKNGCTGIKPDVNAIGTALDTALGSSGDSPSSVEGTPSTSSSSSSFAQLITTESRFYTLLGTGVVGNSEVKITAVLDTQDPQPNRWNLVYWKVE